MDLWSVIKKVVYLTFFSFGFAGNLNAQATLSQVPIGTLKGVPLWPIKNQGAAIPSETLSYWQEIARYADGPGYPRFPTRLKPGEAADEFGEHYTDGDMALYNGLLCAVDVGAGCKAVKDSQGRTGEWFRSPRRKVFFEKHCYKPENHNLKTAIRECMDTFSQDMSLGLMLYALKTKDRQAFGSWTEFLRKESQNTALRSADCTVTAKIAWPRVCTYDHIEKPDTPLASGCAPFGHCALNPSALNDHKLVTQFLGISSRTDSTIFDLTQLPPEALAAISAIEPKHYAEHLDGVRILIRMMIVNPDLRFNQVPTPRSLSRLDPTKWGELNPLMLNASASVLSQKNPWNPFFALLAKGPTEEVRTKIIESCPKKGDGSALLKDNWIFEQHSDAGEHLPNRSSGWDCIFVGRLYNKMRGSAGLQGTMSQMLQESLDPIQQSINALSATVTATQVAIDAAETAKREHDRLNNIVLNSERQATIVVLNANSTYNNAKAELDRLTNEVANLAFGCAFCNAASDSKWWCLANPVACVACPVTRRTCSAKDAALNEYQRAMSQLTQAQNDLAAVPVRVHEAQIQLQNIADSHVLEQGAKARDEMAKVRDKLQVEHDKQQIYKDWQKVWGMSSN